LAGGAGHTTTEQVARRAGVTRATVYRRYTDKTELLVRALEWVNHDNDPAFADWAGWRDVGHMFHDWAVYLVVPRNRRLLRRVFAAVDDYPPLLTVYGMVNGGRRAAVVREMLARTRDLGQLPPETDLDVVQEMLSAAVMYHVVRRPDDEGIEDVEAYFMAIMKQVGYRRAVAEKRQTI
jgi:AcrR family transcriptional regulator